MILDNQSSSLLIHWDAVFSFRHVPRPREPDVSQVVQKFDLIVAVPMSGLFSVVCDNHANNFSLSR